MRYPVVKEFVSQYGFDPNKVVYAAELTYEYINTTLKGHKLYASSFYGLCQKFLKFTQRANKLYPSTGRWSMNVFCAYQRYSAMGIKISVRDMMHEDSSTRPMFLFVMDGSMFPTQSICVHNFYIGRNLTTLQPTILYNIERGEKIFGPALRCWKSSLSNASFYVNKRTHWYSDDRPLATLVPVTEKSFLHSPEYATVISMFQVHHQLTI